MNAAVNQRELTYKALAGLAGGALGWLPVEIASHGHSLTDQMSAGSIVAAYVSMALLSGLIGGFILASDEQQFQLTPRMRSRFIIGLIVCGILALPANYYSNTVFTSILLYGGWGVGHQGSALFLVLGRMISWMMMGAMLGAGVGLAGLLGSVVGMGNFPAINIVKGAIGGWIGGFAGGITFDLINQATGGGLPSRLIGLSLIGLMIGLLIGIVQELTKSAWVTVEAGRLKGRQYRLESNVSTIGRAEENPVGLFGDPSVQARHAVIERHGNDYLLRGIAVADGTFLNDTRVEAAPLHDNDRIRIGSYELSFHLRGTPASRAAAAAAAPRIQMAAPPVQAGTGPCLIDNAGQRFPLRPGQETRIGRATDNDIVVAHSSVSRHHAAIAAQNGSFQVRDLGSQNGTFVAGQRVSGAALKDGDAVRLGEASFIFRA